MMKDLGTPNTVGGLIDLLNQYPRETSFGFLNQPIQALFEVIYGEDTYVVFQPPAPVIAMSYLEQSNANLPEPDLEHDDDNDGLCDDCPLCGKQYDEIDREYQICSHCKRHA